MQTIQQVLSNPDFFKGLRNLTGLPEYVWVVDDDKKQYPNADFTTIAEAIAAAKDGDTIVVFPGTYAETLTIQKPLTLYGNGAYVDPMPTGRPGGETIISHQFPISIESSNVTVSGFEITEFYNGIVVSEAGFVAPDYLMTNITLSYNWLHAEDVWTGIHTQGGRLDGFFVSHSIIDINRAAGATPSYSLACIGFSSHSTATPIYVNITISSNIFRNRSGNYNLFAGASPTRYTIDHCVIECNHFLNRTDSTVSDGASFNIGNITDGRFENNVVEHAPGSIGITGGVIRGNTFTNGGSLKLWGNEYGFTRPSKDLTIENNKFTNEVFGNGLHVRTGVLSDSVTCHFNSFADSGISPSSLLDITHGYAIRNDTTLPMDAAMNWWDDEFGPESSSGKMYGPVKSAPWIREFHIVHPHHEKLCWPLSTFRKTAPGFYPHMITGISYVGATCFELRECIELEALVSFRGGTGKNIPVKFCIGGRQYCSRTSVGGSACVQIGSLCQGTYPVEICAGRFKTKTSIHVCCHCDI